MGLFFFLKKNMWACDISNFSFTADFLLWDVENVCSGIANSATFLLRSRLTLPDRPLPVPWVLLWWGVPLPPPPHRNVLLTSPDPHVRREGPQICRKRCWKCCQEPNWQAEGLALYDPFICPSPLFLYINLCVGPLCWSPVVPSSSRMPSYGGFLIVFSNTEAAMAD